MTEILCRIVKTPDDEHLVDVNGGLIAVSERFAISDQIDDRKSQISDDEELAELVTRLNSRLRLEPREQHVCLYPALLTILIESDSKSDRYRVTDGKMELKFDYNDEREIMSMIWNILRTEPEKLDLELIKNKFLEAKAKRESEYRQIIARNPF